MSLLIGAACCCDGCCCQLDPLLEWFGSWLPLDASTVWSFVVVVFWLVSPPFGARSDDDADAAAFVVDEELREDLKRHRKESRTPPPLCCCCSLDEEEGDEETPPPPDGLHLISDEPPSGSLKLWLLWGWWCDWCRTPFGGGPLGATEEAVQVDCCCCRSWATVRASSPAAAVASGGVNCRSEFQWRRLLRSPLPSLWYAGLLRSGRKCFRNRAADDSRRCTGLIMASRTSSSPFWLMTAFLFRKKK